MSGNFHDANYNVTKIRTEDGEVVELELNGKAVEIGSATLENNKTATIDVSTYTEPVEITPTSGKDGMKKATVTLTNIPSGVSELYAWTEEGHVDPVLYSLTSTKPQIGDTYFYVMENFQSLSKGTVESDATFELFVRNSDKDITL